VLDRGAADALVAGVDHEVLPRRDRALRRIEADLDRAVAAVDERARLIRLPVAGLGRATPRRTGLEAGRAPGDPVHPGADHDVGEKGRVIRALRDDELVALDALLDDVPRCVRTVRDAADPKAMTLAERVEREPLVRAELDSVDADDRPRLGGDVAREEIRERPLADEADARAVPFLRDGQTGRARERADFVLLELAERKQHALELARVDRMQKVALIL